MALPKLNTPTYELEVPSTDEKIKYRPFLVKEEKILMIAMESKDNGQIVNAVKDIVININRFEIVVFFIEADVLGSKTSGEMKPSIPNITGKINQGTKPEPPHSPIAAALNDCIFKIHSRRPSTCIKIITNATLWAIKREILDENNLVIKWIHRVLRLKYIVIAIPSEGNTITAASNVVN